MTKVCVLVARDRQKITYSGVIRRGRIRTKKFDEAIGGHISDINVLCTDSWRENWLSAAFTWLTIGNIPFAFFGE